MADCGVWWALWLGKTPKDAVRRGFRPARNRAVGSREFAMT